MKKHLLITIRFLAATKICSPECNNIRADNNSNNSGCNQELKTVGLKILHPDTGGCAITGNSVICQGGTTQLCATAGLSAYLWSNGATTSCISVSTAGTYIVTLTFAGGSTGTCNK